MSRIHEALKKAAQERSAQLPAELHEDVSDVSVQNHAQVSRELSIPSLVEQHPTPRDGNQAGFLRYEELIKRCVHSKWELDGRPNVFQGGGKVGAERFRTLRSRLSQIAGTQPLRRLLVTSSIPAEGKTFVTFNLAQSIVQQEEKRVLLIDADLRMPRLHLALGAPCHPGLTDYLRGDVDEYSAIQRGARENLFLIPAGSEASNPSELLLTERMQQLVNLVTPTFDWIIVDSPPALPVHDASILADLTDGVLLVVRAGSTDAQVAERVAGEFRQKNLVGVVLNRVENADSYGTRYYSAYASENSEAS